MRIKRIAHKAYVQVENVSDERISYSFEIPKQTNGLHWRLPLSFSLEPGQSRDLTIELQVDPEAPEGKNP